VRGVVPQPPPDQWSRTSEDTPPGRNDDRRRDYAGAGSDPDGTTFSAKRIIGTGTRCPGTNRPGARSRTDCSGASLRPGDG
jgi:hypothetical protein